MLKIRPGVMALVHDHQWVELINDLKQRRLVRLLDGIFRCAQRLCKGGKVAVLLIGFQYLLAAPTERIVGQHHNRQLLRDGGGVEVLPVQKLLLGINFHTPAEIYVNFLTVRMEVSFRALPSALGWHPDGTSPLPLLPW